MKRGSNVSGEYPVQGRGLDVGLGSSFPSDARGSSWIARPAQQFYLPIRLLPGVACGGWTCASVRRLWRRTFGTPESAWRSKASRFTATGNGRTSTTLQWIDDRQSGETRKIAVCRPEHTHPVIAAKSGDSGIVHDPTLQEGGSGNSLQCIEIALAFSQKSTGETRKEPSCGIQGLANRCRVPEDSRVGDNCKKLVDAGPGNGYWLRPAHGCAQHLSSTLVKGHLGAMRIDEVRVDGDHASRSR